MLSMTMDKQRKQLKTRNYLKDWLIIIKMMVKWLDDPARFLSWKVLWGWWSKESSKKEMLKWIKIWKKIRKAIKESIGEIERMNKDLEKNT